MNAYLGNRAEAVQETVESDPVGAAVLTLMDPPGQQTWEGTCKELLPELHRFADEPVKASKEWPKTPRALSGRLRRLATFLRETGILVEFGPRGGKGRRSLTLTKKHLHSTITSVTTATAGQTTTVDQLINGVKGDGRTGEVTVDERSTEQTSPPNSAVKLLKSEEHGPTVTEVTEVTVISGDIPEVGYAASDRKNLCLKCGVVEWEWNGTAWACPHCSEAARA